MGTLVRQVTLADRYVPRFQDSLMCCFLSFTLFSVVSGQKGSIDF